MSEADQLLDELIGHWSNETPDLMKLSSVSIGAFLNPRRADDFARPRLERLKELLHNGGVWDVRPHLWDRKKQLRDDKGRAFAAERKARKAHEREQLEKLYGVLRDDYLGLTREQLREQFDGLLGRPIDALVASYISEWVESSLDMVWVPDEQQAAAISSVEQHTLVTARAGSGKTSTLVARAAFLIKHCGVSPNDLLILAFNRKAANEVKDRLKSLGCECPHIMTFHALAYALVRPEESLIYDEPNSNQLGQSRTVQRVIFAFLEREEVQHRVQELMQIYFTADWAQIEGRGLARGVADGLQYRRSLVSETLRGDYIKSEGERAIANFLFEHDIAYAYERNHWWSGRNYRPDFTLEDLGVVIEYFGMLGEPEYDREADQKREYWRNQNKWRFVELTPLDLSRTGQRGFDEFMYTVFAKLGIQCQRMDEDQIWVRIRERSITRFAEMAKTFIGRARKAGLTPSALEQKIVRHKVISNAERLFLRIAVDLHAAYLEQLRQQDEEDFDGLMERAVDELAAGPPVFDRKAGRGDLTFMRFIMIDEFQDFTSAFFRLLKGIRVHCPQAQLFCVGDDWQAINAFAGSDLGYFKEFSKLFTSTTNLNITNNYRSDKRIVDLGNQIMRGRGVEARTSSRHDGDVYVGDLSKFKPTVLERESHGGDLLTAAARRLIADSLSRGESVTCLARRNGLPWYVNVPKRGGGAPTLDDIRRAWVVGLSEEEASRVDISTAHGYKGLEAETVIVLDALDRSYPLIHPGWVFNRVFGDSIEKIIDEERRLFYVACTRAEHRLILITDHDRRTEFLHSTTKTVSEINWSDYEPMVASEAAWVVRVGNADSYPSRGTYAIRGRLKACGYQFFQSDEPYWAQTYSQREGIDAIVSRLDQQGWVRQASGVKVEIWRGNNTVERRYIATRDGLKPS